MTKEEQQRAIRELAAERRELIAEQSGVQPRLDLETLRLDHGAHPSFEAGHCLMEAVAFFAGEPHSDAPKCVSPYLRAFGIRLNDRATAERRQDLVRFVPLVVGTAGDGLDEVRRWMAADHVARVSLPRHLDSAGLPELAAELRSLPQVLDRDTWRPAQEAIRRARDAAWALRDERWAPVRQAVRDAVTKALADRADADADADAVAVAAAAAAADERYWAIRSAVRKAVYARLRAAYGERYAQVAAESWSDALDLYGRLIEASR